MGEGSRPSLRTRIADYFLLERAEAIVRKLAPEDLGELSRQLRLARQRFDAADLLWSGGVTAEALGLVGRGLASCEAVLGRVEIPAPVAERVRAAARQLASQPAAELDADVTPGHHDAYRASLAAFRKLTAVATPLAWSARERLEARVLRIGAVALVVVACIGLGVWKIRQAARPRVSASAFWDVSFQPERAADGDEASEWLLPDGAQGWIELEWPKAKRSKGLRLLNGRNANDPPRAIHELHVDATLADGTARGFDASFDTYSVTPVWKRVDFGGSLEVKRVRITVKSWHGRGASLAEVVLD
jgi:hypothetical protein